MRVAAPVLAGDDTAARVLAGLRGWVSGRGGRAGLRAAYETALAEVNARRYDPDDGFDMAGDLARDRDPVFAAWQVLEAACGPDWPRDVSDSLGIARDLAADSDGELARQVGELTATVGLTPGEVARFRVPAGVAAA